MVPRIWWPIDLSSWWISTYLPLPSMIWWQGEINMDLLWRRIIFLSKRIIVLHPKDPFVGILPMLYAVYLRVYFLALRSGSGSRVGFPSFAGLPGSFAILPSDCEIRSFVDDSSSRFLLVDLRTLKLSASFLCLRFPSLWTLVSVFILPALGLLLCYLLSVA